MRGLVSLLVVGALGCLGQVSEPGEPPTGARPDAGTMPPGTTPVDPEDPNPNAIPSDELFVCGGEMEPSPARIRRIDQMEFTRNIGFTSRSDVALNPLVPHAAHQYSTGSADETLDAVTLDLFLDFVGASADDWRTTESKPEELRCIYNDALPDEACVRTFVDFYLPKYVLFRPATEEEKTRLVAFALEKLTEASETGRERGSVMEQITSAAWLTSGALFRPETGRGEDLGDGVTALDANELALALGFALSDHAPGGPGYSTGGALIGDFLASVRIAAEDGTILAPDTIRALVDEHLGGLDPLREDLDTDERWSSRRGHWWLASKVQRFFREWLGYEGVTTAFKDTPPATSGYEELPYIEEGYAQLLSGYYGYETTIDNQLDDMIARIVIEDTDVLRTLLTTRRFFLPSNLSDDFGSTENFHYIYGYTADIADAHDARWVELPADERAGVLTHPAWLAAHGDNFENGPSAVTRGKWIRENLLCGIIPDIPITVDASFPPTTSHLAGRERLAMSTGDAYCQGCHHLMNPLGLPFEIYNHAGYLRAEDHGATPSGASTLVETGDPMLDVPVASAVEMAELLGDSQLVERCFIRQVFRFFMGRAETRADACTLTAMENAYAESGGSFTALIQTLMTSPTFLERVVPPEEASP